MGRLTLEDGSRVGIVGGGPAGTLTAWFLLDLARRVGLSLEVTLYESKNFEVTGPSGCNMCGGIISESLVQLFAAEGLLLPPDVVMDTIDAYALHTEAGSVSIRTSHGERRIAAVYRGGGPRGAEGYGAIPWRSFDAYLLAMAQERGARLVRQRVVKLDWLEGRPRVHTREGEPQTHDLLVGAVGLNGGGVRLFQEMGFGYQPPPSLKAYINEVSYGEEEVRKRLGHAMHVFLLDVPGMMFAALTPKGYYGTFIILGKKVEDDTIARVFDHPRVRPFLPPDFDPKVRTCKCEPRINVGDPVNYFSDRVVMVGDCGISRLYKDGIGAAYRVAKACALTAIAQGVGREDFQRFYEPVCRKISRDNRLGHYFFAVDGVTGRIPGFRKGLLQAVEAEGSLADPGCHLSTALWDIFTGSAPYSDILTRAIHPRVLYRVTRGMVGDWWDRAVASMGG